MFCVPLNERNASSNALRNWHLISATLRRLSVVTTGKFRTTLVKGGKKRGAGKQQMKLRRKFAVAQRLNVFAAVNNANKVGRRLDDEWCVLR